MAEVDTDHHARADKLFDLAPFLAERYFFFGALLIHVDQRATFGNVLQLFFVHTRMLIGFVDNFKPDKADDDPKATHKEEHM
ncbi:hypothetical protein D3C72_2339550 [compost metagenome]